MFTMYALIMYTLSSDPNMEYMGIMDIHVSRVFGAILISVMYVWYPYHVQMHLCDNRTGI